MSDKKGIVVLEKGSQEAKDYMARLRSLRKPKTKIETVPISATPPPTPLPKSKSNDKTR
jgi:hypothetical protein